MDDWCDVMCCAGSPLDSPRSASSAPSHSQFQFISKGSVYHSLIVTATSVCRNVITVVSVLIVFCICWTCYVTYCPYCCFINGSHMLIASTSFPVNTSHFKCHYFTFSSSELVVDEVYTVQYIVCVISPVRFYYSADSAVSRMSELRSLTGWTLAVAALQTELVETCSCVLMRK